MVSNPNNLFKNNFSKFRGINVVRTDGGWNGYKRWNPYSEKNKS